ncbi:MAG: hypothetical protein U0Z44_17670 [Kouleothrix sp.]
MERQQRIMIAVMVGLASAGLCYLYQLGHGNSAGDLWIPAWRGLWPRTATRTRYAAAFMPMA